MKRHVSHLLLCLALLLAGCSLLAVGAAAATPVGEFDSARYGSDYPDLLRAYGPGILQDELYLHYLRYGAAEGRTAYSLRTGQPFVLEENAQQAYQNQLALTGAEARLNNASLTPDRSWPEPLLAVADEVLAQVGGATPCEKLRGCYDWLIQNCSYGSATTGLSGGGRIADDAYGILVGRVGVCDNYSAAFAVLARMIGFDARLQNGMTHMASGGYTGHAWCMINIHGVDYVFDPQVEDNIAAGGPIRYLRFCKTYEEVPDKYSRFYDDVVQDSVMAGGDAGPTYAFGKGGDYFAQVNQARAEQGLAPLVWDVDLARAALRIARGEDSDLVESELESQTGKSWSSCFTSYGFFPSPSSWKNVSDSYKSIGVCIYGVSMCAIYSKT